MPDLYVGLDISLELTNVCVVDMDSRLVHESRVGSDPEMVAAALRQFGASFVRVGFEAGPLSQ
jgi:transposase